MVQPHLRAWLHGDAERGRPGPQVRVSPPVVGAAVDAAADGADRISVYDDPQGFFSAAGYRFHLWHRRDAAGFVVPKNGRDYAADRRCPETRSYGSRHHRLRWRIGLQSQREYRPDVHPAET